jgi:hypothetical protein
MSDYVVHLTKGADPRSAFYSILLTGIINATAPSGIARDLANMNQNAAGFSEIPVQEVDRLANRYSAFGLGFHHNALVRQGGARVWYVELDRQVAAHLAALKDHHAQMNDPTDPFWAIAPFIERPGIYGNGSGTSSSGNASGGWPERTCGSPPTRLRSSSLRRESTRRSTPGSQQRRLPAIGNWSRHRSSILAGPMIDCLRRLRSISMLRDKSL